MEKSIRLDKITMGVCYYPEHWSEKLWEDDLQRMLDHGIEVIRIGEFAWNKFEPSEGEYNFDFFDRFMEVAKRKGMKVIFCTPTATPPAWLTHKYPEVLNAKQDGVLYRHGERQHNNYNSPVYRDFTARIVEKIAQHYSVHPSVIGWQIDNELNCGINVFYSEVDHKAFRQYLKNKFVNLDVFNEAMGTDFWNQTYTSWDEVFLARTTVNSGSNNPHLLLEEKRFISESAIGYCKLQVEIVKKYIRADQFITTNGVFGHLDSHKMTNEALDFMTFDSYPNFAFDEGTEPKKVGNLNDRKWSWSLARTRSISPNFGIMEQQSGPGGWQNRMKQPSPKPGQMRLWTFQSIAHGADFISYFRWRTCWIGTEIYWHGLNDYSNMPNRRLQELNIIKNDIKNLAEVAGSKYQAKVAFIKDYDNEWDGENDIWHGPIDRFSDQGWFTAAQLAHTPMDFLYLSCDDAKGTTIGDLQKYDLLIYPHATILTEERAKLLREYVAGGGQLIMGARTGYKDKYGRCPMQALPGLAGEICGVRVVDFNHLGPNDDEEYAVWDGEEIEAPVFNDIIEALPGANVLANFKGNYYDGAPALVSNHIGKGTAYYFGAGFSAKTAETFLRKLGFAESYKDIIELPAEAEIAVRLKDNRDYIFVLNYMSYPIKFNIRKPLVNILTGKTVVGEFEMEKYGVSVWSTIT